MAEHGGWPVADPSVPDWGGLELPDSWPDRLDLRRPRQLLALLRRTVASRRSRVQLPAQMPGAELLPKYLLQEFHNLPNGNYSRRISRGYITGFDRVMLGHMRTARTRLADFLRGCDSAIDIGCGGGRTAAALHAAGVREVWGLDPSPYLLQHAAHDFPQLRFVQGLASLVRLGRGGRQGRAAPEAHRPRGPRTCRPARRILSRRKSGSFRPRGLPRGRHQLRRPAGEPAGPRLTQRKTGEHDECSPVSVRMPYPALRRNWRWVWAE